MAYKIILKRSSILGKRPSNQNLGPGEVGLNTNAEDPGAFFEVSDGNIVKIGPVSVSNNPPITLPEKGEVWFDLAEGSLKIGTVEEAKKTWRKISAPYLGGGGTTVFVAPEFPYSSDNLKNDGQTLPYQTITRAVLELSKIYIQRVSSGFPKQSESNRYTVILASSRISANNGIGSPLSNFTVKFPEDPNYEVTTPDLKQFNSESGGLIIPSGISVVGIDLRKSVISPTFVPSYRVPTFPAEFRGTNQPISTIFKCSGNTYFNNFSATDKIAICDVVKVESRDSNALFFSERPHGFEFNQSVAVTISSQVNQNTGSFKSGSYYAIPLDTFRFYLSAGSQDTENNEPYVQFSELPIVDGLIGPLANIVTRLRSAHRLRLFGNVSVQELSDYYEKVQVAFSDYFAGKIINGESLINNGDSVIVGPTDSQYPDNESSNTTQNSSMYGNQVNLRSEYGMCWGDFDGAIVSGFKSVVANACTTISIQNDPSIYEIYTTLVDEEGNITQKWWNLTQASYLIIPQQERPSNLTLVDVDYQLSILNDTPINNIRYFYQNLVDSDTGTSLGILDQENDFRNFGFRVKNGAYGQFQSIYTIGCAVGVWALNGGVCNLTNSTTNFGSVSFKAEGFLGINTIGGATQNGKNFVFEGIQRPLALTRFQTEDSKNRKYLYLGGNITNVYIDSTNPDIQILEINTDFYPNFILPYSLKPGSAIWVESSNCVYRGFFAVDGGPTVITGLDDPVTYAKLRLRSWDSTIPNGTDLVSTFGVPYIRRFEDPRKEFDRCYSFYIKNTSGTAIAPQVGSVMRLNQFVQGGTNSLKPNVQFDPGTSGGWGRVFTVDAVQTGTLGSSPQFNYVIGDANQDLSYYCAITVSDYNRPWKQGAEFKNPAGSYTTFRNRNWYVAENNLWDCLYYGEATSFTPENGPYSLSPSQLYCPFVDSSVMDRQDPVESSYQGQYAQDPYILEYLPNSTYMRGATSPYTMYATTGCYDDDDGSSDLGLCLKDIPDPDFSKTFTTTPFVLSQTEEFAGNNQRYRPAIVTFSVLSPSAIPNPRQGVTVIQITQEDNDVQTPNYVEYLRVISLNGVTVKAIRLTLANSRYPSFLPPEGTTYLFPSGCTVEVCKANLVPESYFYDPDWTLTKSAVLRFFNIMGYSNQSLSQVLQPKSWGERLFYIYSFNTEPPQGGYANSTDRWPLEFNQPSTVIANTHTWAYTGYYNYSRGLLKYQTTDISKKLSADYQATTTWGGRLTVTGINDKGEIVQFGPQRQALTANYYNFSSPANASNNAYEQKDPAYVEFPSQVSVYSADDISDQFDNVTSTFNLTKNGTPIPTSQLLTDSVFVILGAVIQKPFIDYTIPVGDSKIMFNSPVPEGVKANIRVITSDDSENTLTVVPFEFIEQIDGNRQTFSLKPSDRYNKSISPLLIDSNNTFVILGGVEQIPQQPSEEPSNLNSLPWAYKIDRTGTEQITITFSEPIPVGTKVDIRSFCTASYWASRGIYPVTVYSLDSISNGFNGSATVFDLTYLGQPINPVTVNQENLIVNLGGSVQLPGEAYTISVDKINFQSGSEAPLSGTSTNLRLIGNSEFIACQVNGKFSSDFMKWGPELVLKISENLSEVNRNIQQIDEILDIS
jgi:hypothetical protein